MELRYMDNIKNDKYYINKVIVDINYLIRVTKDINIKELEENEMLLDSIMFRFIQISENFKRVTEDIKNNNTHIPWNLIIGLRNKIVHEYGKIDLSIIYEVLKTDLRTLLVDLVKL